jgi:hypothetical protein
LPKPWDQAPSRTTFLYVLVSDGTSTLGKVTYVDFRRSCVNRSQNPKTTFARTSKMAYQMISALTEIFLDPSPIAQTLRKSVNDHIQIRRRTDMGYMAQMTRVKMASEVKKLAVLESRARALRLPGAASW